MNYRSKFGKPVAVNHDRLLWVRYRELTGSVRRRQS
jgi:hypothetical protein